MATKVIILGEEPKEVKQLKPIEFVKYLSSDISLDSETTLPSSWKHVDLVIKDYTTDGLDVMLTYDNDKDCGALYLGHYNDGIKEVKPLKPIEFVEVVNRDKNEKAVACPRDYQNIELICSNYSDNVDVMLAYDDNRNYGCLYIGYFNDGIV
jgi:hypothetical protein